MKNVITIFGMLLALLMVVPAHGNTLAGELRAESRLNKSSPNAMFTEQLGSLSVRAQTRVTHLIYDFSKLGGAVGTLNLRNAVQTQASLPSSAVIIGCFIDVQVPLTSSGAATVAISTGQTANDLKAATAYTALTGIQACIPVGTAATAIKLTSDVIPNITIGTAALTAGKLSVIVQYALDDK